MKPVRIFSTRPVNFKIIAGRPVDRFLTGPLDRFFYRRFLFTVHVFNEIFSKGGHGWGVKICDFGRGSQKRTQKNFCVFCKNDSILRPFLVKFRFETSVLSSAKCAQNKHKKHWRAQTKLLNVLFCDHILRKAKKWSQMLKLLVTDYLQFAEQQTLNFFSAVLPLQLQKDKWEKNNSRR